MSAKTGLREKNKNVKKNAAAVTAAARGDGEARAGGIALAAASFTCGTCVMVLEMAGSRVVAPYMGTSLVVWTSLIGIVMASLTLGYWLGGVVSDRHPRAKLLAQVIGGASLSTALVAVAANPLLNAVARNIPNVYVGSVIAALALFSVPSVLLGMVSPFIVRLAMQSVGSSGSTVGRYSALSSAGSILGTFLGGFVLISVFASSTILFIIAGVLALTALGLYRAGIRVLAPLALAALACTFWSEAGAMPVTPAGININTRYNHIRISDTRSFAMGRTVRILQTDPLGAQSLMYTDAPNELFSEYTKFYDLAFHYKPDARNVLMLGGGGYCVPKHLAATRPDVAVDVVELDPGITKAARDYFNLVDHPGTRIYHEDARQFLNREARLGERKYDAIFEDVFGSAYNIPFHLTSVECMRLVRSLLSTDGVFIVNVIGSLGGKQSGVFGGIYESIAAVFPEVMIFPASYPDSAGALQNVMIVALAEEAVRKTPRAPDSDGVARLLSHKWTKDYQSKVPAFTDAFAPVERYSLRN